MKTKIVLSVTLVTMFLFSVCAMAQAKLPKSSQTKIINETGGWRAMGDNSVSTTTTAHPLIGTWKFTETIGSTPFTDYITITGVGLATKKVTGRWTLYPSSKIAGYFNGNSAFIATEDSDFYWDSWYFTFQGTPVLNKHLGMISLWHDFQSAWHKLTATKISNSTTAALNTSTASQMMNQGKLKRDADLRVLQNSK